MVNRYFNNQVIFCRFSKNKNKKRKKKKRKKKFRRSKLQKELLIKNEVTAVKQHSLNLLKQF